MGSEESPCILKNVQKLSRFFGRKLPLNDIINQAE